MDKKITYVKPEHHNDWGMDYWLAGTATYINGDWTTWSLKGNGDAHKVIKEGPLKVRWPDGNCETVQVVMNAIYVDVGDMGQTYETTSYIPHLVIPGRGEVSIETCDVEVELIP